MVWSALFSGIERVTTTRFLIHHSLAATRSGGLARPARLARPASAGGGGRARPSKQQVPSLGGVSRGRAWGGVPQTVAALIDQIKESADKLAKDRTSRGDLKILSRTLQELRYAFKVFTPYRSYRKVTMFGSARTLPQQPAYRQAVEFGRQMADNHWMVVTGAASGIMEAGHLGAGREHSMGLNILLPFEQAANRIIAGDPKLVHMKYFFTRKLMFVKESDAICLLPGGFGTLDEGLEVLTLLQTGKRDMIPVVLLDEPGGDYWSDFQAVHPRAHAGPGDDQPRGPVLYRLTDSVDEAVAEILGFFRVYHSMRYVHGKLVLRLNRPPAPNCSATRTRASPTSWPTAASS